MKIRSECWGVGPFDNLPANDVAFIVTTAEVELSELFESFSSSTADCQKVVALGELINALRGHVDAVDGCPMLAEWVAAQGDDRCDDALRLAIVDRLEKISAASHLKRYWEKRDSQLAEKWLGCVQVCGRRLRDDRKGGGRKFRPLSKKKLELLAEKEWGQRDPGGIEEVFSGKSYKGYDQLEVFLRYTDAATAVEMTLSRSVIGLWLFPKSQVDDNALLIPLKLLLRGWWQLIQYIRVDLQDFNRDSELFLGCIWELANLPSLETIETHNFTVDDAVVEAFCANPRLAEMAIYDATRMTKKSLDYMARCESLHNIRLYDAKKLTKRTVNAFLEANPQKKLSVW